MRARRRESDCDEVTIWMLCEVDSDDKRGKLRNKR